MRNLNLSRHLFWDTNSNRIDWDQHAQYVITRVLMRGTLSDWSTIKDYYGAEAIKRAAMNARYLDKVTLSFCSAYFNTPKEEFRCFTTPSSIQKLWNY